MAMTEDTLAALDRAAAPGLRRAALWRLAGDAAALCQFGAMAIAVGGWAGGAPAWQAPAAAAAVLAAGLARAAAGSRADDLADRAARGAVADLRARLMTAELGRFDRSLSSGAFAALVAQKLPSLRQYLGRYRPARLRAAALPVLHLALACSLSWAVALILAVAAPLIPLFMALIGMAAEQASRRQMAEIGSLNSLLTDRLAALPDIRLLDAGARTARGLAGRADALRARTMEVLRIAFLSSTVLELFAALGTAMVAVYVGFSLLGELRFGAWATPLTLGEGVFLLLLTPAFFQPLRELAGAWHDRAEARAVAAEIAAQAAGAGDAIPGGIAPAPPLPGPATIRIAGAAVDRAGRRVPLPDLCCTPGEMVALAGPSGAGKSTALLALAGLLPLAAGRIEVAGRTLDDATAPAWRARLAWLPQGMHVPDQSLAGFLAPGPGRDLAPALAAAAADGVVARLPGGLTARLGETGAGVSGGEARRLLLARALASPADVVLADEPTADLDEATARIVIDQLRAMAAAGRAVLVASHDPALLAAADRQVRS